MRRTFLDFPPCDPAITTANVAKVAATLHTAQASSEAPPTAPARPEDTGGDGDARKPEGDKMGRTDGQPAATEGEGHRGDGHKAAPPVKPEGPPPEAGEQVAAPQDADRVEHSDDQVHGHAGAGEEHIQQEAADLDSTPQETTTETVPDLTEDAGGGAGDHGGQSHHEPLVAGNQAVAETEATVDEKAAVGTGDGPTPSDLDPPPTDVPGGQTAGVNQAATPTAADPGKKILVARDDRGLDRLRRVVAAKRAKPAVTQGRILPPPPGWPVLDEDAYHGLAGDIVKALEPVTEADPAAMLFTFLTMFGNLIGRSAYMIIEDTPHYLNLFTVIVGSTAGGRKGTSLARVKAVFSKLTDGGWLDRRIMKKLVSSQALINRVRDRRDKKVRPLLWIEQEYAGVLEDVKRAGSLSEILRSAWDSDKLENHTKTSSIRARRAHVSLLGHITREELLGLLRRRDISNGLAGRHLWVCARRRRVMTSTGDSFDDPVLVRRLQAAVDYAPQIGQLKRDEKADALWEQLYGDLTAEREGVVGVIASRAAPHVMRLGCVYAVLDKSHVVRVEHLKAALALWGYVERSVAYIFGDSEATPGQKDKRVLAWRRDKKKILEALTGNPQGLTQRQVHQLLGGHRDRKEVRKIGLRLVKRGYIEIRRKGTGGRPAEVWTARQPGKGAASLADPAPTAPPPCPKATDRKPTRAGQATTPARAGQATTPARADKVTGKSRRR